MAALTLMSSCSHRLTKLFGSQSVNSQGIYYVNLCVDGMWRYVFVDDRVPVDGD